MVLSRLRIQVMGECLELMASGWSSTSSKFPKLRRSLWWLQFTTLEYFASLFCIVFYFPFVCFSVILFSFEFGLFSFSLFHLCVSEKHSRQSRFQCGMFIIQVFSFPVLFTFHIFRHWGHCLILGWGWWAYSCVRFNYAMLIFGSKFLQSCLSVILNCSVWVSFWYLDCWRSDFQSSFCARSKLCGKMVDNTFGWEKFPCLSFSFLVSWECWENSFWTFIDLLRW